MKTHITKAVAVLMAFITLMSVMPLAALAELLPTASAPYDFNGDGVIDAADADIFASVEQGKVTSGTSYNAMGVEVGGKYYDVSGGTQIVDSTYSPYEPLSTADPNHPFIQGGAAWINLKNLFYGAPATQNYPITKWSANTSVFNVTDTGKKYEIGDQYPANGEPIYVFPDMNLIDEYLWADSEKYTVNVGGEDQNGIISSESHKPYEGTANNATNIKVHSVTAKNGTPAYVYNRYDPMQGKWGLTLDQNVSSVTWVPSFRNNYYGDGKLMNNSLLYLTDTPYLYYSTEAPDTTKIAISLLIGTPVQSETKESSGAGFSGTEVNVKQYNSEGEKVPSGGHASYVYRWYTITDNSDRPGIDESTRDNSMVPIVHVSDPVIWDANGIDGSQSGAVLNALINGYKQYNWEVYQNGTAPKDITGSAAKLNPVLWADEELKGTDKEGTFNTDSLYANGSITGCIDFTNILSLLLEEVQTEGSSKYGKGRNSICYKIAQVRVDTKTADKADNSAARLNYLYFGPAMSTVYAPQSTVGSSVNAANWQYAQSGTAIADDNPGGGYNESDANTEVNKQLSQGINHHISGEYYAYDSAYTNGWENGEAVTIINTPNEPQKIVIDTYGNGQGQLNPVTYDANGRPTYAVGNKDAQNASTNTGGDESKLWQVDVDGDGELETFEAKRSSLPSDNENGEAGQYYIMVTIPIRKWINVLGNSRKLSMTVTVENPGNNPVKEDIALTLWGSRSGGLGYGHADFGTRFRGEGILAVFGSDTKYQVDHADTYTTVLIDETMGQSTVYNTEKVVTMHHRPNKHDANNTSTRWDIVEVSGLTVYSDSKGNLYYLSSSGNTWYTISPELAHDKYPLYFYPGDGKDNTYYYDSDSGVMRDGDGNELDNNLSLTVMEPLYNFNQVTNITTTDKVMTTIDADGNEVKETLTVEYNNDETWADLLRSPYMYKEMVKSDYSNRYGFGMERYGHSFVTALRIAVPYGAKLTIQNMKGDDNSAGLNMYSTDGAVVNAYDGGTGEQPEIDVTTQRDNTEYADGWGSTRGIMRDGAAAYGPYLHTSNYTIHDILDTENIQSTGAVNGATQKILGVPFEVEEQGSSAYNSIMVYNYPFGGTWGDVGSTETFKDANGTEHTSTCIGQLTEGTKFMVYGTVTFTDAGATSSKGTEMWGLVTYGSHEFGWVKLRYNNDYRVKQLLYPDPVEGAYDAYSDRVDYAFQEEYNAIHKVHETTTIDYHYQNTTNALIGKLQNEWVHTPFTDSGTNTADSMFTSYDTPYLMSTVDSNQVQNMSAFKVGIENGTETVFRYNNGANVWRSGSIGRSLKNPIELKIDAKGFEKTYPVLYYDFTKWSLTDVNYNYIHFGGSIMAIIVQVNDTTNHLYYLNANGELTTTKPDSYYDMSGYVSLKKVMTDNGYVLGASSNPKIEIVGFNMFYTCNNKPNNTFAQKASMTLRRFEVWMDETPYLDIIYDKNGNQNVSSTGKVHVADSFNLINDTFYYTHDEAKDGTSYKKNNSNKGWSAQLKINGTNYNAADASSVENVYEYRTSLGHLRTWIPGKSRGQVAFTADRSFSTANYKYLYYSYSVRDPHTGIAAADHAEVPGITLALKSSHGSSVGAYLQNGQNKTWTYHSTWTGDDCTNNTDYTTTMNAAIDLTSLNNAGVTSINQLVFYFNNSVQNSMAEFYLNYVILSNVAPDATVATAINAPHTQYYYLMDNTGDRYSARFPTIDNPSGAVTGTNSDTDRVNPVVIERGDRLSDGTYFNGDPLYGYGETANRDWNENEGSVGYYEKNYNTDKTDLTTGSMKSIMFYMGKDTDDTTYTDILDYYQYKDTDGNGTGEVQDMLWSYGRWNLGAGESAMNTMYVNESEAIVGNLTRRYATENYVLLRSGIEPRRYPTYYHASTDGEFIYEGSDVLPGDIGNTATNNSYYLTETVLNDYFMFPRDVDQSGDGQAEIIEPVREGWTFKGWKQVTGDEELTDGKLHTYNRKGVPGPNFFEAMWEEDTKYTDITNTAYFLNGDGAKWVKREATQDGSYKIIVPTVGLMWSESQGNKIVAGWKAYTDADCKNPYYVTNTEDGTQEQLVYYSGSSLIMKCPINKTDENNPVPVSRDLYFEPILLDPSDNNDELITVTVTNADLKLYIPNDDGTSFTTNDPAKQGIGVTPNGNSKVYYNIPKGTMMIAYPTISEATVGEGDYVWTTPYVDNGMITANGGEASVLSTDEDQFIFSASNDGLTINYGLDTSDTEQIGNVTTFLAPRVVNRQMTFSSMYQPKATDGEGNTYTAVAYGTMYLTGAQDPANPANFVNYMQLDESKIDAATIASGGFTTKISAVKQVKASGSNRSNQYALTYAASTEAAKTIWMRAYVIYQKDGTDAAPVYEVTYSSFIVQASVGAKSATTTTEAA